MTFKLTKSSCVAVGTFNQYILHAKWLADEEVIERGTEYRMEFNLNSPGHKILFPRLNLTCVVTPRPNWSLNRTSRRWIAARRWVLFLRNFNIRQSRLWETTSSSKVTRLFSTTCKSSAAVQKLGSPRGFKESVKGFHRTLAKDRIKCNYSLTLQAEKAIFAG